jgi:hypothetical protein
MLLCGDKEGKIIVYKSFFKGKKEKKNHDILIAHARVVTSIDMNSEYVATSDERNEIMIWSISFMNFVNTFKIPEHCDHRECFEFVFDDPHEKFEGESKITDLKFIKEPAKDHYLLVLESRGCVHIINTLEGKISQIHVVNVGQFANFDLDYDPLGTRLFSLDADLKIRIFIKAEVRDVNAFRNQALEGLGMVRMESSNPSNLTHLRKVSFLEDPNQGQTRSKSKSILKNPKQPAIPADFSRKRTKAVIGRRSRLEEEIQSLQKSGGKWAFFLINTIKHPIEKIPVTLVYRISI